MIYTNYKAAFDAQCALMWTINEMSDQFTEEEIEDMIRAIEVLGNKLYNGWEVK